MENPLHIMLIGASGRLGKAISDVSEELPTFHITHKVTRSSPQLSNISLSDVVLDVSLPEALESNLDAIVSAKKPLVVGSTGHTPKMLEMLKHAAAEIPVFLSSNFAPGISVLKNFLKSNPFGGKVSISESHHDKKKDAPSGTAKEIATLTSTPHEHIEVIREGDILGDHKVSFKMDDELLEISHKTLSRNLFAKGALQACQYLSDKDKGLYTTIYD